MSEPTPVHSALQRPEAHDSPAQVHSPGRDHSHAAMLEHAGPERRVVACGTL